ncbi:MAG: transporter substrate-binding domain-containing protein [Acidovorax sp.]|uniref:transporter substrate-binding domain-containing protein n=1 Tax=Acidovorax sp. TaxID=1872122 RepID=UPI0039E32F84
MNMSRRSCLLGLLTGAALLVGCAVALPPAPAPQVREVLAPLDRLRVGVYAGSPTSMVNDKNGKPAGVAHDLGHEFARWLGVPVELIEYKRVAEVIDAMKMGAVDFTFTNATEARARDVNFTLPMISLELGYLVPAGSNLEAISEIDRVGVKVGVTQGSSSQGVLGRQYKQATLVTVPTMKQATDMLKQGQLDAFATNKGILNELADNVPGARILSGRWGLEHMAIAVPKGRESGMDYLNNFALTVRRDGTLSAIVTRSGLRGTVEPSAR